MTRKYQPLVMALGRGLDQASVLNDAKQAETKGLVTGKNLDFGLHGGVSGRPGSLQHGTFSQRTLTQTGLFGDTNVPLLANTGYGQPSMITVRDSVAGERPGLVTRGRMWSFDGTQWTDKLGITQARNARIAEFLEVGVPDITVAGLAVGAANAGCASWDFGPINNGINGFPAKSLGLMGTTKAMLEAKAAVTNAVTCGNGARCGTISAIVHQPVGTNKIILVTYNSTTNVTAEYTVAASGADTCRGDGDAPVICCDYDQTVFFVAYLTTTPGIIAIKRITPSTGATATSTTWNNGFGLPRCLWITNTSVATNKLVLAATNQGTDGVATRILNATTLADQALDLAIGAGVTMVAGGQVAVGAAENGVVWVLYTNDDGAFHISKRSLTAATVIFNRLWLGRAYSVAGSSDTKEGQYFHIQHQPINVGGRILFGMSTCHAVAFSAAAQQGGVGATWSIHDVTDLWDATGVLPQFRDPVVVAKGPFGGSMKAWGPQAAILQSSPNTVYRFPTVDWQVTEFHAYDNSDEANAVIGGVGSGPDTTVGGSGTIYGERGVLGLNEITLATFQAAHFKESTLIAGSVPRMLARGGAVPVSFPVFEHPTLRVQQRSVSGIPGPAVAQSYSVAAVWTWIDDAGQLHNSEPSPVVTYETSTGVSDRLQVTIGVPHFNERESGSVFIELYGAGPNPAAGTPLQFVKRYAYPGPGTATVEDVWDSTILGATGVGSPIYTAGGVLEAQCVNASGGLCTLGNRCWASDGFNLYASRLGALGEREAPSWHVNGPLTVEVPAVAGRVIGLGALDDKLLAFCERGVYFTQGAGPDDTDQGQPFEQLTKVSDLGLSNQRGIVNTPKGIAFHSANQNADNRLGTGGIWLLDRSLSCNVVSTRAQSELTSALEGCYLPEREQVYWASQANPNLSLSLGFGTVPSELLMWDLRADQWCTWVGATGLGDTLGNTLCAAAGVLWSCGTNPKAFTSFNGMDTNATTGFGIDQVLTMGNVNVGADGLRWGRVRSLSILGDFTSSYTLNQSATLDDFLTVAASPITMNDASVTTWPTGRHASEWRLPQQKCSAISVTITANPAVATWTALVFEIFTQGTHAPSRKRQ